MSDATTAPEGYERIEWTDVRKGDVLMHENGDRLGVSAVDFDGYQTCKSTAGSWHSVSTLRGSGFSPYRCKPEMPNEPGAYLDKDGDYWLIDRDGSWYAWATLRKPEFFYGKPRIFAPFTRLVPMPTREQVAEALPITGGKIKHALTDAVMALLAGIDSKGESK